MCWAVHFRLGLTVLAAVGFGSNQASAQGGAPPRLPDIAPPRVGPPVTAPSTPTVIPPPPPQAPVVTTPTPTPQVPTRTVITPDRATPEQGGRPGSGPPPYTDSQIRALPGVTVSFWSAGQPQQATSDSNGVVSLGRLSPGVQEVTLNTRSLGGGTGGNQPAKIGVLIALLLPAVATRGPKVVQTLVPSGADLQVKLGVDAKGEVTSVNWFSGGVRVAVGDVTGDGRTDIRLFEDLAQRGGGDTRLVVVTPVNDAPSRTTPQVATRSPSGPSRWSNSTPLPGLNATLLDASGRNVGRAVSDANGVLTFDRLPQGKYDLVLPGSGNQPATQRVLIGLLLPAVQSVRLRTLALPASGDKKLTLDVGPNGEVTRLASGGITAMDDWEAPQKLSGSLPAGVGITRLALALDTGSVPEGRAGLGSSPSTPGGLPKALSVGVSGTGPGGMFQMHSDTQGVARFGVLPIGNTAIEFNGADLATAVRTTGGPVNPTPQKAPELLVVIAIIALKTNGEPVVFAGTWPANALPKSVKADLRVGRDGNLMTVNWGNGPQAPHGLTKTGTGTLTLSGAGYTGATTINAGTLQALQNAVSGAKPGEVVAMSALQ